MSTITIRIEDDLKARIAAIARRAGKTPHAFILDAITCAVEQAELDGELLRIADERWAKLLTTGKTVSWSAATAYLDARSRGNRPRRPSGCKNRR